MSYSIDAGKGVYSIDTRDGEALDFDASNSWMHSIDAGDGHAGLTDNDNGAGSAQKMIIT